MNVDGRRRSTGVVTITGGDEVTNLQVLLEERKLRVAGGIAEAAEEMKKYWPRMDADGRG